MAKIVFALCILLDVFPLEVGAAAAEHVSLVFSGECHVCSPAAFFTHSLHEIHGGCEVLSVVVVVVMVGLGDVGGTLEVRRLVFPAALTQL